MSTPPSTPWTCSSTPHHSVHSLPLPVFSALSAGNLPLASSLAPNTLLNFPSSLITPANRGHWERRLGQVASDPEQAPWMSRIIIYCPPGASSEPIVVGRIGYHGKPDEHGMTEVGYEIAPEHRSQGHAKAAVQIMVHVARQTPGVNVLRAHVVAENWMSRRVVEGQGLRHVRRELSPRWGLQDVFEIDLSS